MAEVEYTKSNATLDGEARLRAEKGEDAPEVGEARSFAVEGNKLDGYIGVSPEYQNYASETHAPLTATEGLEADLLARQQAALSTDLPDGVTVEKDAPERVEPQAAVFNIEATPPAGSKAPPRSEASASDKPPVKGSPSKE